MQANIARQNNFLLLTVEEWQWIRDEVIKDFPNLTIGELESIISNGVKGKYDERQPSINSFTIFKWIKKELKKDSLIENYKPITFSK